MKQSLFYWFSALLMLAISTPLKAADIQARIEWYEKVVLTTPVSGVVQSVNADVGNRVKSGDVLLKLEQEPFITVVKQAKAAVARHTVIRDEAVRELERNQEMYDRTQLSQHDLEVTKIALKTADADLRTAQTRLDQASYELGKSVLKAPFSGMIIRRDAVPGMTVVNRLQVTPLFEMVNTGKSVARAVLSEEQLQSVKSAQKLDVTYAGKRYSGNVRLQLPDNAASTDRQFLLDVIFAPDANAILYSGESAVIHLP